MKLKSLKLFLFSAASLTFCIAGPVSDPCSATTCGKGAECRVRSNLVICVCPNDLQEGDPFVECKPIITSTVLAPSTSSSSSSSTEAAAAAQEVNSFNSSPNFNLSPEGPKRNETLEDINKVTDEPNYFPSAPPTLSHYAHTPPFYQPSQSSGHQPNPSPGPSSYLQQSNQLFSNNRNRNRPFHQSSSSFPGTINHGLNNDDPGMPVNHIPVYHHHQQQSTTQAPHNPSGIENPGINHAQNQVDRHSDQQQRHGGLTNNKQPHTSQHGFHSSNQFPTPHLQNSYNNLHKLQNSHSTNFNLKQETHIPSKQELLSLAKDPLGVYGDCRTINNRVVCADTSSQDPDTATRHRIPQTQNPGGNNGFEHRHIAIANENTNSFINSPTRVEIFPNPSPPKINHVHAQPEERPHFRPDHHPGPGPVGTVNFYPASSSSEIQSDAAKIIIQETSTQPPQQLFTETKPYIPQKGTDESNMCQEMCGEGAVCRVFYGRPICGCPEGHTGDPSKKCYPEPNSKYDPNTCQRHTDCSSTMVCFNSQCADPCLMKGTFDNPNISSFHYSLDSVPNTNDNMCGTNAVCSVIEHTPVCSCRSSFYGNPYIGCVP